MFGTWNVHRKNQDTDRLRCEDRACSTSSNVAGSESKDIHTVVAEMDGDKDQELSLPSYWELVEAISYCGLGATGG